MLGQYENVNCWSGCWLLNRRCVNIFFQHLTQELVRWHARTRIAENKGLYWESWCASSYERVNITWSFGDKEPVLGSYMRRAACEYKWVFVGCKPVVLSSPCPGVWLVAKEFTLLWLVGFESSSMSWAGPHSLQLPKLWESSLQITQNVAWCTKNEAKHHEKLAGISEYFWTLLWPVSVAAPIFCIILLLQQSHQMYSQDCSTSTKHYSTLCTANRF